MLNRLNFKQRVNTLLATNSRCILIASMGRAGSTVLFRAVKRGAANNIFSERISLLGEKLIADACWDLNKLFCSKNMVIKTHGLPTSNLLKYKPKVIFIYGSASDSIISILANKMKLGDNWYNDHLSHLGCKDTGLDITSNDALGFQNQIESWRNFIGVERLLVHYDELWHKEQLISDFCGFQIKLPERKERNSKHLISDLEASRIRRNYAQLDHWIEVQKKFEILT